MGDVTSPSHQWLQLASRVGLHVLFARYYTHAEADVPVPYQDFRIEVLDVVRDTQLRLYLGACMLFVNVYHSNLLHVSSQAILYHYYATSLMHPPVAIASSLSFRKRTFFPF